MDFIEVVKLYVYYKTNGIVNQVDGVRVVYHTGVFVFGREYFYGPQGIETFPPGRERRFSKRPHEVQKIGYTSKSRRELRDFVRELGETAFRSRYYNVLNYNCNIFSQKLCEFLCGVGIPQYILNVQEEEMERMMQKFKHH